MNRLWRYLFPCYLFTVIMTGAGFAIANAFYRASSWQWRDGVLTCIAGTAPDGTTRIWGKPNAQTLGWIIIFDTAEMREMPDLRVHENVHVVQAFAGSLIGLVLVPLLFLVLGWSPLLGLALGGFVGGVGFALAYGILFLYLLWKQNALGVKGWYYAYRANPFEEQAYRLQDKYLADTTKKPWGA